MSTKYRVVGLASIAYGTVNTTLGYVVTTITTITAILDGSAKLALPMSSQTDYYTEDSDVPDMSLADNESPVVLEFATRDMSNGSMTLAFGGTASNTTIWKAGIVTRGTIEKYVRVTTKAYGGFHYQYEFPRMALNGGGNLVFSNKGKNDPGTLNFSGKVLMPVTANTTIVPIKRTKIIN